jgi:hypothetical protein
MKKIYTLISASAICLAVNAQTSLGPTSQMAPRHQLKATAHFNPNRIGTRSTDTYLLNNDSADTYNTYTNFGGLYQTNQINDFNMHYKWPLDSSSAYADPLAYATVAFDSLFDPYSITTYTANTSAGINVDSLFLIVGQQNLSGNPDTLVTEIVSVDANGYPTSTVLWTNTTIIPASASLSSVSTGGLHNSWLYGAILPLGPNYLVTGTTKFAVNVKYYGNKLDTFGLQYGFPYFIGGCPVGTGSYHLADKTGFSHILTTGGANMTANSFARHINLNAGYVNATSPLGKTWPTAGGGFLYYDCDGTSGYAYGIDGADYIQNFSVIAQVTTTAVGIKEYTMNGVNLGQNQPNPTNGNTTIFYELTQNSSNVAIDITDITGKKVASIAKGKQAPGKYSVDFDTNQLDAGIYFYTLKSDNAQITRKMNVIK